MRRVGLKISKEELYFILWTKYQMNWTHNVFTILQLNTHFYCRCLRSSFTEIKLPLNKLLHLRFLFYTLWDEYSAFRFVRFKQCGFELTCACTFETILCFWGRNTPLPIMCEPIVKLIRSTAKPSWIVKGSRFQMNKVVSGNPNSCKNQIGLITRINQTLLIFSPNSPRSQENNITWLLIEGEW